MVKGTVLGRAGRRMVNLAPVAVTTVLIVAACNSAPSSTSAGTTKPTGVAPTPSSSAPTSPASPADVAKQQALAAYSGMWTAMTQAGLTSNYQSPKVAQYAAGDALSEIDRSLYTDHLNGVVTKGQPTINPHVTSVSPAANPTTLMISDCGNDSAWLKYKTNGQLQDNTPGGRRSITAEAQKQPDGSWKVIAFAVEGVGTC